jgi:hypothetical protein
MRMFLFLACLASACAPHSGGGDPHRDAGGPDQDVLSNVTSIDVSPPTASLSTGSAPATQGFTATAHFADGHTGDITSQVAWSLADPSLGFMDPLGTFTSVTTRGGKTDVVATVGSVAGKAELTVKWIATRVSTDDGSTASAGAATQFGGTVDPALAPKVVYPLDGALVPQNLGELEVQWTKPAGATLDLFEVSFEAPTFDLKVYTNATVAGGGRLSLLAAEWAALASSVQGDKVSIGVRAVATSAPASIGAATPVQLAIGIDAVSGGIYYWSSTSAGASVEGINRHAFGDVTSTAQPFYTQTDAGGHCVACHVLSRDGKKSAITYDGGDGPASVIDVATKAPIVTKGMQPWNFATFNPDGTQMAAASKGVIKIYDTATSPGMLIATVATGSKATHPDWSPDGKGLVFVSPMTEAADWSFTGGSIVLMQDAGMGFTGQQVLVTGSATQNNYYPSFSPDGKWILFNRSTGDSYDDPDAGIYVVSADGKIGPIALAAANAMGNLTNSWPRWSPFVQPNGPHGNLFYLTFSSKRDYGIEIVGKSRPQVWMTAFDPSLAQAGSDPSSPPFWLPFQDPATSNHIAQWTQTIVPSVN